MNDTKSSPKNADKLAATESLILFDGVCGLCNKFVQYVLNHDPDGRFRFASLQSDMAREILQRHGRDPALLKTIYLIRSPGRPNEQVFTKSAAALRIIGDLQGASKGLKLFLIVPAPLRDLGYDMVAAVRYKVFGKHDVCPMPTAADRERFLDI
ncbi:DCC1-like thiol-disulfide oxidoreductase family protein [soil metagenome]